MDINAVIKGTSVAGIHGMVEILLNMIKNETIVKPISLDDNAIHISASAILPIKMLNEIFTGHFSGLTEECRPFKGDMGGGMERFGDSNAEEEKKRFIGRLESALADVKGIIG